MDKSTKAGPLEFGMVMSWAIVEDIEPITRDVQYWQAEVARLKDKLRTAEELLLQHQDAQEHQFMMLRGLAKVLKRYEINRQVANADR